MKYYNSNFSDIDRETVKQVGMAKAQAIFGEDTDESIVDSMTDHAIELAGENGTTESAGAILSNMFHFSSKVDYFAVDAKAKNLIDQIINKSRLKLSYPEQDGDPSKWTSTFENIILEYDNGTVTAYDCYKPDEKIITLNIKQMPFPYFINKISKALREYYYDPDKAIAAFSEIVKKGFSKKLLVTTCGNINTDHEQYTCEYDIAIIHYVGNGNTKIYLIKANTPFNFNDLDQFQVADLTGDDNGDKSDNYLNRNVPESYQPVIIEEDGGFYFG